MSITDFVGAFSVPGVSPAHPLLQVWHVLHSKIKCITLIMLAFCICFTTTLEKMLDFRHYSNSINFSRAIGMLRRKYVS